MNDFQNAYDLSRMEYRSQCQRDEVDAHRFCGKYVVCWSLDIHCRFTDAVIATEVRILGVYPTREQAEKHMLDFDLTEDSDFYLVGPGMADAPELEHINPPF